MANISKKAAKKAHKCEKHLLAKQHTTRDSNSYKIGPHRSHISYYIATGTVQTVAELDAKLNRMEQQWAKTSTSPLPGGIRNAVMGLTSCISDTRGSGGATSRSANIQCIERQWGGCQGVREEMESTIRRGEKEKESANEEK